MRTLDKGQDKIKKISEELRREILEPAQEEAKNIVEDAKKEGQRIVEQARKEAEEIHLAAKKTIEQERNIFQSSLLQASKQALEALRQDIENNLFNEDFVNIIQSETTNPKAIANLIQAVVKAIEKEGLATNLAAVIPKAVSVDEVNQLLGEEILKKLENHSVKVGNFAGGAQVKLIDKKLTIDISNDSLKDLLSQYARKDFRKLIYAS